MSVRKSAAAAVMALAIAGGVAAETTPASANTSQGYISAGTGAVTTDWAGEGNLSTSSHAHSNATALWQAVLWADGNLTRTSQIDCRFGSATRDATRAWQRAHSLARDGIVGNKTFSKADNKLKLDSLSSPSTYVVHYDGSQHDVWFKVVNYRYQIRVKASVGYKTAYYNSASACG
ncbi:peptidoglycan-binding domain-containing protein [Streptomyces mirabilis]|uniref:peptidoglycan-binding domain-containing protein n=1 Tax=Streptomyces mirabilis TaxID=68239 RepID=UPI0033C3EE30